MSVYRITQETVQRLREDGWSLMQTRLYRLGPSVATREYTEVCLVEFNSHEVIQDSWMNPPWRMHSYEDIKAMEIMPNDAVRDVYSATVNQPS